MYHSTCARQQSGGAAADLTVIELTLNGALCGTNKRILLELLSAGMRKPVESSQWHDWHGDNAERNWQNDKTTPRLTEDHRCLMRAEKLQLSGAVGMGSNPGRPFFEQLLRQVLTQTPASAVLILHRYQTPC